MLLIFIMANLQIRIPLTFRLSTLSRITSPRIHRHHPPTTHHHPLTLNTSRCRAGEDRIPLPTTPTANPNAPTAQVARACAQPAGNANKPTQIIIDVERPGSVPNNQGHFPNLAMRVIRGVARSQPLLVPPPFIEMLALAPKACSVLPANQALWKHSYFCVARHYLCCSGEQTPG